MGERQHRLLDWEDRRVRRWVVQNKGVLTRIAVQCHVSSQYASQVAYGMATSMPGNDVEKALKQAGWPGIRQKVKVRGV